MVSPPKLTILKLLAFVYFLQGLFLGETQVYQSGSGEETGSSQETETLPVILTGEFNVKIVN